MDNVNERRRSNRLQATTLITCYLRVVDQEYQGVLRDLSVTGLYMELPDQLTVSGACEVEIVLKGDKSQLKIECQGSIVRCDESGVGVHFTARNEWFPFVATYFQRSLLE